MSPSVDFHDRSKKYKGNISRATLEALGGLLINRKINNKDTSVTIVHGRQQLRDMYRREGKVKFPLYALIVDSIVKDRSSYSSRAMSRMGVRGTINKTDGYYYQWLLRPIIMNITVRMICQDVQDHYAMAEDWLFTDNEISFNLQNEGLDFGILIQSDDEVGTPEIVLEEAGELFESEVRLTVHTYAGTVQKCSVIKRVGVDVILANDSQDVTTDIEYTLDLKIIVPASS